MYSLCSPAAAFPTSTPSLAQSQEPGLDRTRPWLADMMRPK